MKFLVSITIAAILAAAGLAAAYGVGPEGQGLPPDQKEAAAALKECHACFRYGTDGRILGIIFDEARLTDKEMPLIARLPDLERVDLFGARITDAGLPYLTGLTKLKE